MSEWSITTDQLKELYEQKVQEQKDKENQYFTSEFPEHLSHLEPQEKLEDYLINTINESVIVIDTLPFEQATKEKLTTLLLRFKATIEEIGGTELGLESKIKSCEQAISFLDKYMKRIPEGDLGMALRSKVINIYVLFKSIKQYFNNSL